MTPTQLQTQLEQARQALAALVDEANRRIAWQQGYIAALEAMAQGDGQEAPDTQASQTD